MIDLSAQARVRQRLTNLVKATRESSVRGAHAVDVIISHVEVCAKQGTGVLTQRIFGGHPGVVSVRGVSHYGGVQEFGDSAYVLSHGDGPRRKVYERVLEVFAPHEVRRIVAIPYYPDDFRTAVALKDITGAPLCTWVMDDQNHDTDHVPDALCREALAKSDLRLAISAELRDAYERKHGLSLFVVPPLAPEALVRTEPTPATPAALAARRGVVIGNVWGSAWLKGLLQVAAGSGVPIDWYASSGLLWSGVTAEQLAAAGVTLRAPLPEPALVQALRDAAFVVHPSGTLDEADTHGFIARLSLPSKLPFVLACTHAPTLVLGHPETAAARFVVRNGLGLAIPYERRAFEDAVAELCRPEVQARMRAKAASLAERFSSRGAREWIFRSLELGRAADDRFESLFPPPEAARPLLETRRP